MIAASCVATDMAGGRHPVAPMTRFHAEEDRRRSVMRPGSRKNRLARESALFFQRRKDGALSCPDCAIVRDPFYLMESMSFGGRGVKTTPRLRDKGRILAAGRPAHIRSAGL